MTPTRPPETPSETTGVLDRAALARELAACAGHRITGRQVLELLAPEDAEIYRDLVRRH